MGPNAFTGNLTPGTAGGSSGGPDWMPWAAAGASALGTGIFGMIGSRRQMQHDKNMALHQFLLNRNAAMQQNQWNREIWDDQKNWNLEMWNRQNEYNTPAQQVARFREAGLSPHLMYGQGGPGNASPVPSANLGSAAEIKGYQRAQAQNVLRGFEQFGQMYTFRNLQAQTDNAEAHKKVLDQEAINKATDGLQKALNLRIGRKTESAVVGLAKSNLEAAQHNARRADAQANILTESQKDRVDYWKKKLEIMGEQLKGEKGVARVKKAQAVVQEAIAELAKKGIFVGQGGYVNQIMYSMLQLMQPGYSEAIDSLGPDRIRGIR